MAGKSWVEGADGSDFGVENLPWGVFATDDGAPRVGVRIGDFVFDVAEAARAGQMPQTPTRVFDESALNAFIALGRPAWSAARTRLKELLGADAPARPELLVPLARARMRLPIRVEGFTDFYSSRQHATNVGRMFRPDGDALTPNWLHIPIGYNGRASTVVVSGTPVRRPLGQLKPPHLDAPIFAACRRLDFELEMGVIVGAANAMGEGMSVEEADRAIFGYALLNDWSARDIQHWEYQPLGPFQAKAFATSLGAWVVTQEALEPFRVAGPVQDPIPLPYLRQPNAMNFDVELEVALRPRGAARATTISRTSFKQMYWSSAQQLAHHASSGCAMRVGDLLGSGTISGAEPGTYGSLLELSWGGKQPLTLDDGSQRAFLEDGDQLAFTGRARRGDLSIGFGECAGEILPAREIPT